MKMNYSVKGASEMVGREPLTIGRHYVEVSKVMDTDRDGNNLFTASAKQKIRVILTVLRGDCKGRQIMDDVVFFKEGDAGLGITMHKLKVMGATYDAKKEMFVGLDTDDLVGAAQFYIDVIPNSRKGMPIDPKYPVKVGGYVYADEADAEANVPTDEILEDHRREPLVAGDVEL